MKKNVENKFKIPEGYFDNFNEKLMNKIVEEESLIPKNDGFSIPNIYFESLSTRVTSKVVQEQPKVIQLKPYKNYYFVAASIAAVLLLFFGWNWNTTQEPTWDDLANADIEAYFETNELGFSTYEIAEVIPVDELEINDILENQFDEENIIDYLNDNIDTIEDLNLEDYE